MADVSVPTPPPPPPPPPPPLGNAVDQPSLLGDSILPANQSGTSLLSLAPSESSTTSSTTSEDGPGKRAASIDEIRGNARKWSLAGDAGILLYFKQFSQNMLRRTHELEKVVDSLSFETKGLDSKVHNTFNDFLMLSNRQFIENRVYDEEISQDEAVEKEPQQPQSKSREQLEAEILPRFSQAVNLGFQVLDDAFITVELKPTEESDEEDEESLPAGYVPDPIIEPKDMYASRPLPHLIGTAEFFSDETLGLIEIDDEEEEKKNDEDDDDVSESESESEEEESDYTESSDEEEVKKQPRKQQVSDDSESEEDSEDSDGDLFGDSKKKTADIEDDESESEDNEEASQAKPKINFQAELASKIGVQSQASTASVAEDKDDKADAQSISSRKSVGDAQPTVNAEETGKSRSGSHSKREGKHRSSSHRKQKGSVREAAKQQKHHHKAQEEESDDDLFGESKNKFEDDSPFGKKSGMFSGGGTLFDSEPGNDLFGDIENGDKPSSPIEESPEPQTPTEIKPRTKTTSSGKKIPAGAVSLFGDTDLFGGGSDKKTKEVSTEKETSKGEEVHAKKPPPVVKGLFGEDEEDALFDTAPKKDTLKEPPKQKRKKTLELFDENEDPMLGATKSEAVASGQPSIKIDANGQKSLEDSNKSEGLFGAVEAKESGEKPKLEVKKITSKPKAISLFDDDEEEEHDWFDNINPSKNKTPSSRPKEAESSAKQTNSLFEDSKISEIKATPGKNEEAKKKSKAKVASLFDEDEDDGLFATSSPASSLSKPKVEKKDPEKKDAKKQNESSKPSDKKSSKGDDSLNVKSERKKHKPRSFLGDDESGLFGDDKDDLFTTPKEKVSEKAEKQSSKPKKAAILLDDDEEDDLFDAVKSPKTKHGSEASKKQNTVPIVSKSEVKVSEDKKKKADSGVKGIFGDDGEEEEDLFSAKAEVVDEKLDAGLPKEAESTGKENKVDEEPAPKPKKLAGAVSLFGGIDPFAAKKNLRSSSKEQAPPLTPGESKDDDLFSEDLSKKASKPAVTDAAAKTPVLVQSSKETEQQARKPVDTDALPKQEKKEEPVVKDKPKIVFNPATMVPGAAPPPRNEEPTAASFEDPPSTQILTNPTKSKSKLRLQDRARIQKKRRPPTRQMRQNSANAPNEQKTVPETAVEKTSNSKPKMTDNFDKTEEDMNSRITPVPEVVVNKESRTKAIKAEDIFADEVDNLFGTSATPVAKTMSAKAKQEKAKSEKKQLDAKSDELFASDISSKTETDNTEEQKENKTKPVNKDVNLFFDDSNTSDEIFSVVKSNTFVEDESNIRNKEITNQEASKAPGNGSTSVENTISSSAKSTENANVFSDEDDLFGSSTKTNKEKSREKDDSKPASSKSKDSKKGNEDTDRSKKKKEKSSIFNEGNDDDLFSGNTPKKENKADSSKKTSKASRTVTDDELFGDSGSIFDVPSKAKEKKKKKADGGSEDIFATGGEKKTKPKKKAEKTTKAKATKPPTSVSSNTDKNIFDDPLNALGGE
ncbi:WASH complex subunit 2C-like isoform X1 [Rhopilema esculentum]|uniref:WASH complex subunit 2C-like isoform X1 n=1 Tax=Rhopilema esculentum TaxID=499914 RepID=UPI0031E2301E